MYGGHISRQWQAGTWISGIILILTTLMGTVIMFNVETGGESSSEDQSQSDDVTAQSVFDSNKLFMENNGQLDNEDIRFYYQTEDTAIGFISGGYVLSLTDGDLTTSVIRITFSGSRDVTPWGRDGSTHTTTYFKGRDTNDWIRSVSSYRKIIYPDIYRGIDLVFYFTEKGLKYDWMVDPYADHSQILMEYQGIEELRIDPQGALIIRSGERTIREESPISFQEIHGSLRSIPSAFNLVADNMVGYDLGYYDSGHQLIIDPLLATTFLSKDITPYDMILGKDDNIYMAGVTFNHNFPSTPGTYSRGGENWFSDLFFCKFNKRMSRLEFAGVIGGDCHDGATALALDSKGNIIIVGYTRSSDFPITDGAYNHSIDFGGNAGIYLTLNADGSQLLFSSLIPWGTMVDIVMASDDFPYLIGSAGAGFPTTPGSFDETLNGSTQKAYVMKFDPENLEPIHSTLLGGAGVDSLTEMFMDSQDNVYLTGLTSSVDFPTTPGCYRDSLHGGETVFVSKLNANLSNLAYSTFIGNIGSGSMGTLGGIAVDHEGYVAITGTTFSANYPVTDGCADDSYGGAGDIFVTKLNQNGSALEFSTFFSGNDTKWDHGNGIAIDFRGYIYITGETNSLEFPTTPGCFQDSFAGGGGGHGMGDCLVTIFQPNGSLEYSSYVGGFGEDFADVIRLDSDGNAVVGGHFRMHPGDFPFVSGGYDPFGGQNSALCFRLFTSPKPQMHIDSVSPNPALDTETIYLKGHSISDSPVVRYVWMMDGFEVYNGTSKNAAITHIPSGNHTIHYKALNVAGYWGKEAVTELLVHSRPEINISSVSPNPALDTDSLIFTGTGTDDGTIVQYSWRIGSVFYNSSDPVYQHPALPLGKHTITFRVQDNFGIWSNESVLDIVVAKKPEAIILPFNHTIVTTDEMIPFRCSSTDGREIIEMQWTSSLDGELFNGTGTAVNLTGLFPGNHTIYLRIMDIHGFWSNTTSALLMVTERPEACIDVISPNAALFSDWIQFNGDGSDDGRVMRYLWFSSLDGEIYNGSDSVCHRNDLSLGIHTISLKVGNDQGFWSHPASIQLVVTTRPTAIIDTPLPDTLVDDETLVLKGNGTDDEFIYAYSWISSIDGMLYNGTESRISYAALSLGNHTISLRVCDNRGFWSDPVSDTLLVHDRPEVNIDSVFPSTTVNWESISFEGRSSDDSKIIAHMWHSSIDGELSHDRSFQTATLSRGIHTITFSAMDEYGSWSIEVTTSVFIMSRPVSFITNVSHSVVLVGQNVSFLGFASDDGDIGDYRWRSSIDGIISEEKSFHTSDLSPGDHSISYRARDEHGLWSDDAIHRITVHERPTAEIISILPEQPLASDYMTLCGDGWDDGSITRYSWRSSIDGELYNGTWKEGSSRQLTQGQHTVYLKVQDDHGIWSEEVFIQLNVAEKEDADDSTSTSLIFAVLVVIGGVLGLVILTVRSKSSSGRFGKRFFDTSGKK